MTILRMAFEAVAIVLFIMFLWSMFMLGDIVEDEIKCARGYKPACEMTRKED